jgi:hypothetical protein
MVHDRTIGRFLVDLAEECDLLELSGGTDVVQLGVEGGRPPVGQALGLAVAK